MTDVERFVAAIQAERTAKGQQPTIQSEAVYRLLLAVLARQAEQQARNES
jgi:hypothetical protein